MIQYIKVYQVCCLRTSNNNSKYTCLIVHYSTESRRHNARFTMSSLLSFALKFHVLRIWDFQLVPQFHYTPFKHLIVVDTCRRMDNSFRWCSLRLMGIAIIQIFLPIFLLINYNTLDSLLSFFSCRWLVHVVQSYPLGFGKEKYGDQQRTVNH